MDFPKTCYTCEYSTGSWCIRHPPLNRDCRWGTPLLNTGSCGEYIPCLTEINFQCADEDKRTVLERKKLKKEIKRLKALLKQAGLKA